MSISKIKSAIKKKSRFLDAYNKDGTLVVEGLLKDEIQTAIFNDYMEDGCKKVLKFIESSPEPYYILNGEQVSLYGLMKAYESYQPSSISRYKGLGEMQPVQLRDSTLHPDHDRHLVRFTTSDILKELDAIRQIESNKSLLLKDVDFAGYEL
jgi:DNA gyrase/topoisomerase IV subunit B